MDRRSYLLRVLASALWALGLFICTGSLARAQTSGGSVRVSAIANQPQYFTGTGDLLSHVTYEGRMAAGSTGAAPVATSLYYRRQPLFTKAAVAALARKRLKNMIPYVGQALLLKELIEAGGEIYMQSGTGDIISDAGVPDTVCGGAVGFLAASNQTACTCAGIPPKLTAAARAVNPSLYATCTYQPVQNCPTYSGAPAGTSAKTGTCPAGGYFVSYQGANGTSHTDWGTPATQATDDQIVNAMKAGDPTEEWVRKAWAEPFKWPDGTPVIANPMPSQMAEVAAQYRTDTGVALASGTTDPTYADETALATPQTSTPGAKTGTEENPTPSANASASASVSFPIFCTWAATVCEGIDWIRNGPPTDEPDPSDQPQEDLTPPTSGWVSGLGAGTCPAPKTYAVGVSSFQWSYTPFCDLAALIKPLVLLAASFMAALILAGIGKTSPA